MNVPIVRLFLLLILSGCAPFFPAAAQSYVETAQTHARLLVDRDTAAPGADIQVGLSLELKPGWHTYWRTPGDSGLPATLTWQLPNGIIAAPLQWPTPSRVPTGNLMNFGYEGRVVLPSHLMVDSSVAPGKYQVVVDATWLACADICIPEDAHFAFPLTIGSQSDAVARPDAATLAEFQKHLPIQLPWPLTITREDNKLLLDVKGDAGLKAVKSAEFFPYDENVIENAAPQVASVADGKLSLALKPGTARPQKISGVLAVEDADANRTGYTVEADVAVAPARDSMTLWLALAFAFIGGLILNVMPCVLPILAMKVFALTSRHLSKTMARRDALLYTAGVGTAFLILAGSLIVLRAGGQAAGWGFHLQNPAVVAFLAAVMLVLGLSLSGVFAIGAGVMGYGQALSAKSGAWGAYFTGVLAVVVATPCTAPFMGAALGFALTQPWALTVVVFEGLALGFAAPFLAIAFVPAIARAIPRPGAWMERFKQFLAFGLYGAAAWLLWVLTQQVDAPGLAIVLLALLGAAFAAWCWGVAANATHTHRAWTVATLVAVALSIFAIASLAHRDAIPATATDAAEAYSPDKLEALRAQHQPVLVDFTAAWCITCLLNERVALSQPSVRDALRAGNVTLLKADWTNRNADITDALHALGRDGVPVYALYPADGGQPILLPQVLTPATVIDALKHL